MAANDWDGMSGNQAGSINTSTVDEPGSNGPHSNNTQLPSPTTAQSSNKMMFIVMGGLMLLVMGVFGVYQYSAMRSAQDNEQRQRVAMAKQKMADAERKKRDADLEKTKAAELLAAKEKEAAQQATAGSGAGVAVVVPQSEAESLLQMKRPVVAPPVGGPPSPASQAVVAMQPKAPEPQVAAVNAPQNNAIVQDVQSRDQYLATLESRVGQLSLVNARLETDLCRYEPKRAFCAHVLKDGVVTEQVKVSSRATSKADRSSNVERREKVMLFDSSKATVGQLEEINGVASPRSRTSANAKPSITVLAKGGSLPGLTVLRDRVLYRDRDGMTHEVELGAEIEGIGRLERIDFERKAFQAGGRVFN